MRIFLNLLDDDNDGEYLNFFKNELFFVVHEKHEKYRFFENFAPKKGLKFFLNMQFCRARRALSNHVKKVRKKIWSIFELFAPYMSLGYKLLMCN